MPLASQPYFLQLGGESVRIGLMKRLAILGSTGSIGQNALAVVAEHPQEFRVVGLAAGKNVAVLAEQVRQYRPSLGSGQGEGVAGQLRDLFPAREGVGI